MDLIEFTHNGEPFSLSRRDVVKAMKSQVPGRIQTYAVDIGGVRFPVKQVLAQSIRVPLTSFVSTRARDLLEKLDFEVINVETELDESLATVDLRALALELAVGLHGRRQSDDEDVLTTARRFETWLEG